MNEEVEVEVEVDDEGRAGPTAAAAAANRAPGITARVITPLLSSAEVAELERKVSFVPVCVLGRAVTAVAAVSCGADTRFLHALPRDVTAEEEKPGKPPSDATACFIASRVSSLGAMRASDAYNEDK